ncbi:complement factor H-related protein 1-like [Anarhichas minor]|uniref:complement factor H-related protein 1-like n=1 Tax=Anarhichas minor TaxID=65739 RepID=UPI003F73EE62
MISFVTKMYIRYLGFGLLIWFPGALHAQHATPSCSAPRLDGGFFSPKQETYSDETALTYTCNDGRKPTVKGWWATSTCLNGTWSPEPQCIDEKACIAPDIPNAQYIEKSGWYNDGHKIRITCNEGYDPKDHDVTTTCINGKWSSVPVCEKNIHACGEPPQIPHAVIILQGYQEFFAADTTVQYECEDGYTVEGGDAKKYVYCIAGNWTEGPVCRTSTTSGSNERDGRPLYTKVEHCGAYPNVPNGDVVQQNDEFLKYQCNAFYTQVGSDTVKCYNNGSWSQLPICQTAFCSLHPADPVWKNLRLSGVEYIKEGEKKYISCIRQDFFSLVKCINGETVSTRCCDRYYHYYGRCL